MDQIENAPTYLEVVNQEFVELPIVDSLSKEDTLEVGASVTKNHPPRKPQRGRQTAAQAVAANKPPIAKDAAIKCRYLGSRLGSERFSSVPRELSTYAYHEDGVSIRVILLQNKNAMQRNRIAVTRIPQRDALSKLNL